MRDIKHWMNDWKQELLSSESISHEEVDEMTDHLYNELDGLRSLGLNDKEAFAVAKMRMGNCSDMETEYSKAYRGRVWNRRVMWMIWGYLLIHIWTFTLQNVVGIWTSNGLAALATTSWISMVCSTLLLAGSIGGSLYLLYRLGSRGVWITRYRWSLRRGAIALVGIMTLYTILGLLAAFGNQYFQILYLGGFYDSVTGNVDVSSWYYWLYSWVPYTQYWVPTFLLTLVGVLTWRGSQHPLHD